MHIEPGVVEGAKLTLSYATAAGALGLTAKLAVDTVKNEGDWSPLILRSVLTTALAFAFFELLPHYAVGVSEVHFILGSTLFLIFGLGPAAVGLASGLFLQGVLFAPGDLPQYGMNVTTLILPLYAMGLLAKRIIPTNTAYKDVQYTQALALSTSFQAGIVAWVAFWAFFGQGFSTENLAQVSSFGIAYVIVVLVEPLVDLAVLAVAKNMDKLRSSKLFHNRLFNPAY